MITGQIRLANLDNVIYNDYMNKKKILKKLVVFKNVLRGLLAIGLLFVILAGVLNALQGTI